SSSQSGCINGRSRRPIPRNQLLMESGKRYEIPGGGSTDDEYNADVQATPEEHIGSDDPHPPSGGPRRPRNLVLIPTIGKTRHFDGVINRLADRGHTVVLAAAAKRGGFKGSKRFHASRRVEVVGCPAHRVDRWKTFAPRLRLARDYLRFFET